jgi:hypothetical protein
MNIYIGKKVYHNEIYNGKELMEIVGIRKDTVELEGDYSGGTHNVCQKDWMPVEGLIDANWKRCENKDESGNCPLHNIYCGYPDCEKIDRNIK